MLKELIFKEIFEDVKDYKFVLLIIFSITIIPLSLYLSGSNYVLKQQKYETDHTDYISLAEGNISWNFIAEGYRPPFIENILADRSTSLLPYKVSTSNTGIYTTENENATNDPLTILFGNLDFPYLVSYILSLFALFASYDLVNREREAGTLKLMLANSVPRHKILIAKLSGNYFVFIIPVILGILIGLLLIQIKGINILSSQFVGTLGFTLLITLLFIFVFFNIGILFSVYIRQSSTAIVILLFIWLFAIIIIPQGGPIITRFIFPVMTESTLLNEKEMLIQSYHKEFMNEGKKLTRATFPGLSHDEIERIINNRRDNKVVMDNYDQEMEVIANMIEEKKKSTMQGLEKSYLNQQLHQNSIIKNLCRISPMSSFQFTLNEITKTGYSQITNFYDQAARFQDQVTRDIYNKFIFKYYYISPNENDYAVLKFDNTVEGFDRRKAPIPTFEYQPPSLMVTIQSSWIDVALLIVYGMLSFVFAYFRFINMQI